MAVGGGSADRKAEELAVLGDASAGAWAAGAEGERRVAGALAALPEAWTVLHDRLLSPGLSPVNLDHVVVGPGGLFLIDAKNWRGVITAWEGNLYQHTGPRDARKSVSKHLEVAKVHGMASYMAAETGMPVTPVICLAGRAEAEFGEPELIRGVWVVPASAVAGWLRSQPAVRERDAVERASVTLMTSFPSTTTDPHLLAAMGASAAAAKPRRPHGRRSPARTPSSRPPRRRGTFGRAIRKLFVMTLMLGAVAVAMKVLPSFVLGGIADAASSNDAGAAPATASPNSRPSTGPTGSLRASAKPTKAALPKQQPATASPAAVPISRCAGITAAQVGKIIGRKVQPVAMSSACAWGTRLDDSTTTLVTLEAKAEHAAYERNFAISASQSRTVYGMTHLHYRPATGLWVAVGQPIGHGKSPIVARLATHVAVSTEKLEVSDDRARALATSIASAANAPR